MTLMVLLHYRVHSEAYPNWAPAVADAVRFLLHHEMLYKPFDEPQDTRIFDVSEKGKFFIEHLQSVPLPTPKTVFEIPTAK